MAELVTLEPLFQGKSEGDQLFAIFKALGSPTIDQFKEWEKILIHFDHSLFTEFKNYKGIDLKRIFVGMKDIDNLMDLLKKMFDYIPANRISAAEAMKHPFFKEFN